MDMEDPYKSLDEKEKASWYFSEENEVERREAFCRHRVLPLVCGCGSNFKEKEK